MGLFLSFVFFLLLVLKQFSKRNMCLNKDLCMESFSFKFPYLCLCSMMQITNLAKKCNIPKWFYSILTNAQNAHYLGL